MPITLNEHIIYATTKITKMIGGQPVSTGTGFLWNAAPKMDLLVLTLITNKHVVEGAESLVVRLHLATNGQNEEPNGRFYNLELQVLPNQIIHHPDLNVDLCGIGLGGVLPDLAAKGLHLFYRYLTAENVPAEKVWKDFDAIEEVTMVGCPRGIMDEANNMPIVRRGITATQMGKLYNGKPEFMVDMACFPGSSGSPAFVNHLGYLDRETNRFNMGARRFFLVGVLYSGPLVNNRGTIVFGDAPTVQVASMMHLGNVIRSSELLAINAEIAKHLDPQQMPFPRPANVP